MQKLAHNIDFMIWFFGSRIIRFVINHFRRRHLTYFHNLRSLIVKGLFSYQFKRIRSKICPYLVYLHLQKDNQILNLRPPCEPIFSNDFFDYAVFYSWHPTLFYEFQYNSLAKHNITITYIEQNTNNLDESTMAMSTCIVFLFLLRFWLLFYYSTSLLFLSFQSRHYLAFYMKTKKNSKISLSCVQSSQLAAF
jgi:hypothetical protein